MRICTYPLPAEQLSVLCRIEREIARRTNNNGEIPLVQHMGGAVFSTRSPSTMLSDPLYVTLPGVSGVTVEPAGDIIGFTTIDPGTNGNSRTVRTATVGGLKTRLIIQRSNTKENKPYGTERITTRIESDKIDADGNVITGFIQVTDGLPKAVFSVDDLYTIHRLLGSILLTGVKSSESVSIEIEGGSTLLNRLCAGEG